MKDSIEKKCIKIGVKLTEQRKIIAKVMSESNDHPNVDELYKHGQSQHPSQMNQSDGYVGYDSMGYTTLYQLEDEEVKGEELQTPSRRKNDGTPQYEIKEYELTTLYFTDV